MRALGDVLIVEHIEKPMQHNGLIQLPESVQEHVHCIPVRAKIISIGSKFRHRSDILPGDIVVVPFHLGTRLPREDVSKSSPQYIVYDGEDVLAKIEE